MRTSVQAHRRQAAGLPSKSAAAATSGSALSRSASGRRRKRLYAKWPSGVGRRIWSCACNVGTRLYVFHNFGPAHACRLQWCHSPVSILKRNAMAAICSCARMAKVTEVSSNSVKGAMLSAVAHIMHRQG